MREAGRRVDKKVLVLEVQAWRVEEAVPSDVQFRVPVGRVHTLMQHRTTCKDSFMIQKIDQNHNLDFVTTHQSLPEQKQN